MNSIDKGCSNSDLSWLRRAALLAECGQGRSSHGAVIVRGGSLIGYGINRSRVHCQWVVNRPRDTCSIHAEVSALRRTKEARGATLYVCRVNCRGLWRRSAPCENCISAIVAAGIKRVVHT